MSVSTTTVSTIAARDEDRALAVITVAFVADSAMRVLYPDAASYVAGFPQLVRAFARGAWASGTAHEVGGFAGAAIWLPAGVAPDPAALGEVLERTVDAARRPAIVATLGALESHHPREPHWYLPFIGVDPPHHGQGLGSSLLAHALAQVDRERRPAFLETANPRNLPLYERHGFAVTGQVALGPGVTVFPMVRTPAPSPAGSRGVGGHL